jgi:hypothetical protein
MLTKFKLNSFLAIPQFSKLQRNRKEKKKYSEFSGYFLLHFPFWILGTQKTLSKNFSFVFTFFPELEKSFREGTHKQK